MSGRCSLLAMLFAFATAVAGALAQDPMRQRIAGRAIDREGRPWSGAIVTLIGSVRRTEWDIVENDEVTVTADAMGRFSARVMPQRNYGAFAWQADGRKFRMSAVERSVVPFAALELREGDAPQVVTRLAITAPTLPPPYGPLRFRAVVRATSHVFVRGLELDEAGSFPLPAIPGGSVRIEATMPNGTSVWCDTVPLTARARANQQGRLPVEKLRFLDDPHAWRLQIPEPTPTTIRVADAKGRALATAVIELGAQDSFGSIADRHVTGPYAVTGADGSVTLPMLLAFGSDGKLAYPHPEARIHAKGHRAELIRFSLNEAVTTKVMTRDDPVIEVRLRPGYAAQGRLLLDADRPAAHATLLVYTHGEFQQCNPYVVRSDADGRFRIEGIPADSGSCRITAIVPADDTPTREEWFVRLIPAHRTDRDVDLEELRLDRLATVEFSIQKEDGTPLDRARILIGEPGPAQPRDMLQYTTDHTGRCRVRVPPEQNLAVFIAHDEGFALQQVRAPESGSVAVQITPRIAGVVSGVVVDQEGHPLGGIRIHARGASSIPGGAAPGRDTWFREFLESIANASYELDYRSIHTDEAGRFAIPFPVLGPIIRLSAWAEDPKRRNLAMSEDDLSCAIPQEDLTITLRPTERR